MTPSPVQQLWASVPGYHCFGCAQNNPRGLGLQFFEDGDEVVARTTLDDSFSSYPGVVHGGIIATLLDEVMGNAVFILHRRLSWTVGSHLQFFEPLLTHRACEIRARIVQTEGEMRTVKGRVLGPEGQLCARATSTFKAITRSDVRALAPDLLHNNIGAYLAD